MIDVRNINKRFGAVKALSDVSFTAKDSHITGLLGPNGAGKSTALRIISTVLQPDTGTVILDGTDVLVDSQAARLQLGVLPHASGLYPRLTARENVAYYGRLNGLDGADLDQRIDGLLTRLTMQDFADRSAKGLSQGQRLKVALARALVHGPRNLVLDEPTNGLDVLAARALRMLIANLRRQGHCVVLSSHLMQEVASLCDEIVIIVGGRVVSHGTPNDIRQQTGEHDLEDAFVKAIETVESCS